MHERCIQSVHRHVRQMFVALAEGKPRPATRAERSFVMKIKLLSSAAVIALAVAGGAIAAGEPMVGGAPMYANRNIIQNAVNSKDHTTLVTAVKAGGLVETLQVRDPSRFSHRPTRLLRRCRGERLRHY
jgi:uncharacterized surface protein with fasciclin (FAS1) repeats